MNAYQQRVLDARKEFLKLNIQQEKELLKIYIEAGKQISYKLSKGKADSLNARYLHELDKSIKQYVAELRQELSILIKDGIETSVGIVTATQLTYFDLVAPNQNIKSSFNKMFTQVNDKVVKKMIKGNYYADGKTLDARLWNLTKKNAKDIDTLIKTNIAKGVNAKELAKELDSYINPLNRLQGKVAADGISNNISYQAKRLARTSLTHANSEAYIEGSKANPFCEGLRWNLSPSHSMRGGNDICDQYAGKVFKADEIPLQHCNCLCYFTQEVMDVDKSRKELIDWVNGADNSKLDNWMDTYGEEFGIDIEKDKSKVDDKTIDSKDKKDDIISNKQWLKADFSSQKKFDRHIKKHLCEYGDITEEEYLDISRKFLAEPLSEDVEGFVSELGFVFKYKKSTNDFAIGRADGYISTLYKPKEGYEHWLEQIETYKKED